MALQSLAELIDLAQRIGPCRVALAGAENEVALGALAEAAERGMAEAVLVGDESRTRQLMDEASLNDDGLRERARFVAAADPANAAQEAVSAIRTGEADLLMKGSLRTDQLLRAVLDRERGLRTDRLLSDVLVYEDTLSGAMRLVGITDGGVNVAPDVDDKAQIIQNAVEMFGSLGFERPRISLMSATEAVTDAIPSTLDAQELAGQAANGDFGDCDVDGPLALDNALVEWAAQAKGIDSPVAGHADVLVVPSIEAGNLLGKAVKYFANSTCAHVIMGARAPVLIPSRVESVEDKLASIALGAIMAGGTES
ncbi:MAG: phosphate acyltransferase [Candidatus Bipolaricaulia bacterium]